MKFYNREQELQLLADIRQQSLQTSRMTVLTGRRRIGKTMLALESVKNEKYLYFFITRKSESLLCEEFSREIKEFLQIPVFGEIKKFTDIIGLLLEYSKQQPLTVIVDEFQDFYNINPAVYSEMQRLWDLKKDSGRLNLIFIGSIYSLMQKIFQDNKEPLFNRADRIIQLKPFKIEVIAEILKDYGITDKQALFDFYLFTGGSPKYLDLLLTNKVTDLSGILEFAVAENSPFINEGRNLLVEEFGRDYAIYFSILELISCGKTSRPEIESIINKTVGGYLDRLESDFGIITRVLPYNAKPLAKTVKFKIKDNFLNFWFRFINKNRSALEAGNFNYLKTVIKRDYATYSGLVLEDFFRELLKETGSYNLIGSYWEKGNQNEIDIVAVDDLQKQVLIAEVKRNKERLNLELLKNKSKERLAEYPNYRIKWLGLSSEDIRQKF